LVHHHHHQQHHHHHRHHHHYLPHSHHQPLLPAAWAQVSTFHMLQSSEAEAWGTGFTLHPI
jgi:hypothetical protein